MQCILTIRHWRSLDIVNEGAKYKIQKVIHNHNSCLMFEILLPEALLKFHSILTKTQIFLAINFLSTKLGRLYNFITEFSH